MLSDTRPALRQSYLPSRFLMLAALFLHPQRECNHVDIISRHRYSYGNGRTLRFLSCGAMRHMRYDLVRIPERGIPSLRN